MKTICGIDCNGCSFKAFCKGCMETSGHPFGGECVAAECFKSGGEKQHIRAAIGHAVGLCCYEVDDAFYETFLHTLGKEGCNVIFRISEEYENPDRWHCDLRTCNRILLVNAALAAAHIDVSEHCTCCHNELFHSHRYAMKYTGGKRGLMAACISMETIR